jgi:hypothetical protein
MFPEMGEGREYALTTARRSVVITEGGRRNGILTLTEWLKRSGVTRQEAIKRLGISSGHFSDLETGKHWLGRDMAMRIWRRTDGAVGPTDFLFLAEPPADRERAAQP